MTQYHGSCYSILNFKEAKLDIPFSTVSVEKRGHAPLCLWGRISFSVTTKFATICVASHQFHMFTTFPMNDKESVEEMLNTCDFII